MIIGSKSRTQTRKLKFSDIHFAFDLLNPMVNYRMTHSPIKIVEIPIPLPTYDGDGSLSGIAKIRDIPMGDIIVSLHEESTNQVVREMVTNQAGEFSFTNLSKDHQFYMVFKDPNGEWEHLVSSRRTPG